MLLCIANAYAQQQNDTIGKNLQELTVKADMQNTNATSTSYYPDSKVKKAAANAIDLLQRMAISHIIIDPVTNAVTTPVKESVDIYINHVKATPGDIAGLKCTDVKKVEYLDFPTDPRFQGNQHVINIIVQLYEYGGYTKISDYQEAINQVVNNASVFSKFVYKKMTYDAFIGSDFSSTKHFGQSINSIFRVKEGTVTRDENMTSGKKRQWNLPISLRATYNKRNMQIANTIGFTYFDMSKNNVDGNLMISRENLNNGYDYNITAPSNSKSVAWNGAYYFMLPKSWSIYILPNFTYSRYNSFNTYSTTIPGSSPIVNNAKEDAYFIKLNANAYKTFSSKHSISMHLDAWSTISDVKYSGSSSSDSDISSTSFTAAMNYVFNHNNKFFLSLNAGAGGTVSKVNDIDNSNYFPFANLNISYAPNQKSQYQLSVGCASNAVGNVMRSSNVIQLNELLFRTGNPEIDNYQHLIINGSYTYFPCNEFVFQAFARYTGYYDRIVNTYIPCVEDEYILESEINSGDFNKINVGANLTGRLFSNRLVIQATPSFSRSMSSGYYNMSHNYFTWSVSAQYYFGNFSLSAIYDSKSYDMGLITGDRNRNSDFYYLKLGWAKNAWNLSVTAKNVFRNSYNAQWSDLYTPFYETHTSYHVPAYHASVNISATYTFGYGKKVGRGNELMGAGGVESAIMK